MINQFIELNMRLSPFHQMHLSQGAHMTAFHGWKLPLSFPSNFSPLEEAKMTRQQASIFDISHMNRIILTGQAAIPLAAKLTKSTIRINDSFKYSLVLDEGSSILDDAMIWAKNADVLLVCNASQKPRVHQRIVTLISQLQLQSDSIEWHEEIKPSIAIQGIRPH